MENKTFNLYSWPVIIILLFVFWPAALYLLYKKAQSEKKTALTASKILNILGTILIVLGVVTIFVGVGVFYLIAGIVLKRFSKKLLESAENTKKYLAIVINGNVRQLDSIAATVGKPYDEVKKDLQKLIDNGYLKNAYINESTREIVIPQPSATIMAEATANASASSSAGTSTRIIACPCCGANNAVVGAAGECEYCGSPLA